ncbi:MAG: hypothetical protein AABY13_02690 [Nanoarchaeota archaeon]
MPIITTSFNKILVQRLGEAPSKNMKINNNVQIRDIAKADLNVGNMKQPALRFEFEYKTEYLPKVAEIVMSGNMIYLTAADKIESILNDWKKDKKAPKDITTDVINNLLTRCNIEALLLSREMGLPSPIPMPKVTAVKQ